MGQSEALSKNLISRPRWTSDPWRPHVERPAEPTFSVANNQYGAADLTTSKLHGAKPLEALREMLM